MNDTGTTPTRDIETRDDLRTLVEAFYAAAFADPVLGPIFTDVAHMDLEAHLPHMIDFWSVAVLRKGSYGRNAFDVHLQLDRLVPLTRRHFQIWEDLWHETVDAQFTGPRANLAKLHASRMAGSMHRRLAEGQPSSALRIQPRR
jgi:hemoglobin